MPRPRKCRKVCSLPRANEFKPTCESGEAVTLTVDEYETIRLIDKEGFSQEEASQYMQVSRATVQQTYNSARFKLAEAIVGGMAIRIEGGDYALCSGEEKNCNCGGCRKHSRL